MDLALSDEQKQLVDSFGSLYARASTPERVRAAEPIGFDSALWRGLCDTGILDMAVPERAGGWGATVADLALTTEQHGRALGSAPVVDAQVAATLLAASGAAGVELLDAVLAGTQLVTFAPRPGRGERLAMTPAGAVSDVVVALVDGVLVAVPTVGAAHVPNLASLPLADIVVGADHVVLATGDEAAQHHSRALDLWLTLTAAALSGAAARAVEMGVDYAKQRHAFGQPIGAFQAVSHTLADCATAADGARLLALRAACAQQEDPARVTELAAMAFGFAYEAAREATHRSLHIHGGYGFGLEGDIQLYYRRVRGWALVFGDADAAMDRAADARYGKRIAG
ncbi:acyl-CoA dehydrogenase [Mycolicibacterium sp. 120266]|uniref:acyl-CoA dehydrogenase family protein n=1 Tax=Mycolicibacterium sp. 120266 TaxID=3090601 RepID=UPI00299F50C4|nr:acyl-CoA dehydrogenase [Mycolicibacterium sp. 120266]MDX1873843.1 acyl-CoA dehydrogenase [Mycolicibacterium sp. 120266]